MIYIEVVKIGGTVINKDKNLMNKKTIGVFIALTFLVGCGCQQNEEENISDAVQPSDSAVTYNCDGEMVKADFDNTGEISTATIYLVDKDVSMTLPNVEAASGAKYSDGEFTFWTHQGDAILSIEGTDKNLNCQEESTATGEMVDENGNVITAGCTVWFDGCNNCQVSPDGMLACTRMFCDPATMQPAKCLDEESLDNDKQVCAEAGGVWSEEYDSCFEDPATMAGEGER